MRGVFDRDRNLTRVLLIESSPREVGDIMLARLYGQLEQPGTVDLLTCYATAPAGFDLGRGRTYSVHQPEAVANRSSFVKSLARGPYDAIVILCAGSGVLAKWKWAILAQTDARVVFADETGDWFFVSVRNVSQLAVLMVRRMHLADIPQVLLMAGKWIVAPLTVLWLVLFAIYVHLRRAWTQRRRIPT